MLRLLHWSFFNRFQKLAVQCSTDRGWDWSLLGVKGLNAFFLTASDTNGKTTLARALNDTMATLVCGSILPKSSCNPRNPRSKSPLEIEPEESIKTTTSCSAFWSTCEGFFGGAPFVVFRFRKFSSKLCAVLFTVGILWISKRENFKEAWMDVRVSAMVRQIGFFLVGFLCCCCCFSLC